MDERSTSGSTRAPGLARGYSPADGGETKLDNILSICRSHHTAIHEGRISIETRTAPEGAMEVVFRDRRGNLLTPSSDLRKVVARRDEDDVPVGLPALTRHHAEQGLSLDPNTLTSGLAYGEPPDYVHIAWVMMPHSKPSWPTLEP
jgi:hypothetical protein